MLHVVSWNIFENCKLGVRAVAGVLCEFSRSGADVIGLQEVTRPTLNELRARLQLQEEEEAATWSSAWVLRRRTGHPHGEDMGVGVGLLTRLPVVEELTTEINGLNTVGVSVRLDAGVGGDGRVVRIFNWHARSEPYGPYLLKDMSKSAAIAELNANGQGYEANRIGKELLLAATEEPEAAAVLMGDFNIPSHRDGSGGSDVLWPATQVLEDDYGMRDAYREVNPDAELAPGHTWPTKSDAITGFDGIPDRLDFMFYRGQLELRSAVHVGTIEDEDWPSDHSAVVCILEMDCAATQEEQSQIEE